MRVARQEREGDTRSQLPGTALLAKLGRGSWKANQHSQTLPNALGPGSEIRRSNHEIRAKLPVQEFTQRLLARPFVALPARLNNRIPSESLTPSLITDTCPLY